MLNKDFIQHGFQKTYGMPVYLDPVLENLQKSRFSWYLLLRRKYSHHIERIPKGHELNPFNQNISYGVYLQIRWTPRIEVGWAWPF